MAIISIFRFAVHFHQKTNKQLKPTNQYKAVDLATGEQRRTQEQKEALPPQKIKKSKY